MMTIKTIVWLIVILSADPKPVFGIAQTYENPVACEQDREKAKKEGVDVSNTMCIQVVVPQMI